MTARLAVVWDHFRNSLWGLPIAVVLMAIGLAIAALQLHLPPLGGVWWLYSGGTSQATGLLGNLLTATITMATLAISITMVVLALAAQSLGPRLIPIFMGDTRTKLTLGTFIGTVAYLLIVLRTVAGSQHSVPQLAVTLGSALVLASMILLLFFVHHLARSIVADTIIGRVGRTLDSYVLSLLPASSDEPAPALPDRPAGDGSPVPATASGYIQIIDHAAIIDAAEAHAAVVALTHRPGQFALAGDILATIKPPSAHDDAFAATIRNAIIQGRDRTAVQDLEFSIRQLVEIALRALSPGVNDPHTALAVIDRLTASFSEIMRRGPQLPAHRDGAGTIRLFRPVSDFPGLLAAAFNEIRQAGATQPAILIRLADRLGQLVAHAQPEQAEAIRHHLRLVRDSGARAVADAADRTDLDIRIAAALHQTAVNEAASPIR